MIEIPISRLGRHAFISIGGPATLHVWEVDGTDHGDFGSDIFHRARVDHFALEAKSFDDFEELRKRLIHEGATQGEVNDFGVSLSFSFTDPDGTWAEVHGGKMASTLSDLDPAAFQDPIAAKVGMASDDCPDGMKRLVGVGENGPGVVVSGRA